MKVWDLPTRLFHWGIVVLIGLSWWSAETGRMDWHYRSGLTALILLVFRLLWGVLGARTARFGNFVRSPAAVLAYLVSFEQGRAAAEVHEISFTMLQVLIALHLLAIAYYRIRGRRLIMPMLTGRDAQLDAGPDAATGGGVLRAVAALVAALALGWWVSAGVPL